MNQNIHIGCSGFYYAHWKGRFYPENLPKTKWFEFYCKQFNTIEINATFYRFPDERMLHSWKNIIDSVNNSFLLTLKGNRIITHVKRLHLSDDVKGLIRKFTELFEQFNNNRGCILWQLHPTMKYNLQNISRLREFCEYLSSFPSLYAIEFRDPSWWVNETFEVLRKSNIAFCVESGLGLPDDMITTATHAYVRFHGPSDIYSSDYSEDLLMEWGTKINSCKDTCSDVFCYFNNDVNAYAIGNATRLREILG
jgi:uncharacterized protein YecE (DUF72 family)